FGSPLAAALRAGEVVDATVADMRFVKPIDEELIERLSEENDLLITVEENARMGGAGSAVLEFMASRGLNAKVELLGIPDRYIEHDSPAHQMLDAGIDEASILAAVRRHFPA
ncbi:MAG: transketolase C-terminal domain-containing protein, partial [Thalassolituus sp.]